MQTRRSTSVTPFDILLLVLLATIWGTAFAFLKIALTSFPPVTIAAIRVGLAAIIMLVYLRLTGRRLPRGGKLWLFILTASCAGLVLPFSLIGWGQQSIDSAVAAICMASVPLYTLPLAHIFTADEKLTPRRALGTLIGFAGVMVLFSSRIDGSGSSSAILGIAAILLSAFSYSLEGLMIRRMSNGDNPGMDGLELTTALLVSATACLLPLSFLLEAPWHLKPTVEATLSLLYLGVIGSAVAMVVMVALIRRVGATITSLNNYLVPMIGVLAGVFWLDENLSTADFLACALILIGIAVTSKRKTVS
ncbi:DMT family transporter [Govanella unica]|uniref:DMT family transporter n=1 Tax=Govanella unica TaxID=2975056 RepID=A0A9X3Z764_9PROT|nr:DMT family transporter [Govania unica]MDA5193654.1 DMT family transporter [Govania unica]